MLYVNLFRTSSPRNKIGKTLNSIGSYSCTIKDYTSVLNPEIIIQTGDNLYTANYGEIPLFGRKYFISDIISSGNNRWSVILHVDVLDTYAAEILQNRAVIRRQEEQFNLYLDDPDFQVYNYEKIQTLQFTASQDLTKDLYYVLVTNNKPPGASRGGEDKGGVSDELPGI